MSSKTISRITGVLYITTVLAFVVSKLVLKGQLVDPANISRTYELLAANAFTYRLAVSIDFLAMVAVMGLAFSLFAILKPVSYYMALLAVGLRIGEVVLQAWSKVPDYLLLTLSKAAVSTSSTGLTDLETLGQLLLAGSTQADWLSFVFLSAGSLFNNFLFYKGKLIPSILAIYGLISTALYALGSCAALLVELPEFAKMGMMFPLVVFELLLGFYLAIFGMKERTS